MAEYSSLKVPELKKLLAEKGLSQTGNKADLIARLTDDDNKKGVAPAPAAPAAEEAPKPAAPAPEAAKPAATETKEDEINYTDDEDDSGKPAKPDVAAPETADAPAPAADAPATTEEAPAAEVPAVDAPPPTNFAIGLASTAADEEAKKRAERAKRFGIEEDDDAKKRAERASRFGLDEKELASGLDSALPERPLKRGRGRGGEEAAAASGRPNKRQSQDRRGGAGRRRGGGRDNNRGPARSEGGPKKGSGILDDPAEKAKAEKRAARFAS